MSPSPSGTERGFPFSIGSYRIETLLASGGMGAVYRAFDEVLRRPVAVKHLLAGQSHPTASQRFRREARAVARLNHPAIVHIYEIIETEQGDWLAMELVEGQTLSQLIRNRGLSLPEALQVGREIAEGLAEAHAQGIVHRDLKAGNVMVTPSGHAKILDFGLAKFVSEASESDLSQTGMLLGTYHAMSPEQVQGLPVDHLSDLFSLGILLYEMLTGVSPFRSATVNETLARICSLQQPAVCELKPEVPRELSDLVGRLLSKAASQRPWSTREVARHLQRLERDGGFAWDEAGRPRGAETPADLSGGTTLVENVPVRQQEARGTPSAPSLSNRERRQMTVVCCELDAGDASSDPETLYDLMLQLRGLAASVASRYGGLLGSVLGRRVLLYFGYPQAYEDNAGRAVRAALDLISEVARIPLPLRAGIHTGPAVVSTLPDAPEPVNLGATLDLAIALQSLAEPGSVVVSPATGALLPRSFALEPLAPARLPGLSDPVAPQRVLEAAGLPDESRGALTPLVGRDAEMALLQGRWNLACEGTGQVVLISGDAGIGKSRLTRALRERLGERAARWISCYGSPLTQGSPLQPVIDLLRGILAGEDGDSPLDQLEAFLGRSAQEEALPLLAALLDLPSDGRHPAPNLAPERQRVKTLEALVGLMLSMAESQPLVLMIEDLHWLDPTTLEWLDRLIDEAATVPLLLVLTLRLHTVELLWRPRAHLTQVLLNPLGKAEVKTLVEQVAGGRSLPQAVREQIVARTDGVPLFVEELTKTVLESGETGERRELPATLRDSLAARLDRLGAAKETAQIASVIGRTFALDLLAAVSSQDEAALLRELKRLVQAELLYRRGFGSQTKYLFKHALVQDAAYDSLLRKERQQLHRRIAAVMEERLSGPEPAQPEVIARHFTAGESFDRAVDFWLEAGRQAIARFAHAEAIEHLRSGLSALAALPPGSDRDRRELPLQSALAASVAVVRGHASPEVEEVYGRIRALTERIEDVPTEIYFGLYNFHSSQGRLRLTRDLGLQRLARGEESQDLDSRILGLYTSAAPGFFLGDLEFARNGFERLLELYAEVGDRQLPTYYDIPIVIRSLLGEVLWLLGLPGEGARRADRAVELSRTHSPFTRSVALVTRMYLAHSMRDVARSLALARELLDLSRENDYEFWPPHCHFVQALAAGDVDQVLRDVALCTAGDPLQSTRFRGWAIELFVDSGRLDAARSLLREPLKEERFWEAELHRLEGRLFLAEGADDRAEGCFQEALAIARGQGARIFELRAAVCLARVWHSKERSGEARNLLRPLYDSFTEGLTTPDLVAAREALTRLEP